VTKTPRFHHFFNPILSALHVLGGSATIPELVERVIEDMGLPPEVVELTRPGDSRTVVEYRMAWARTYLKKAGLITNSERGVWSLTPVGQKTTKVDPESIKRQVRAMPGDSSAEGTEPTDSVMPEDVESTPNTWKQHLLKVLRALPPDAFERLCLRLLRESGFIQVEVTGKTGDGGIDGHGIVRLAGLLSFPIIFQAKRYSGSVGAEQVRSFRGAMVGRADKGLFITTGVFTSAARQEATRDGAPPIDLVDGEDLAEKLYELKLGVRTELVEVVIVEDDWFKGL